MRNLSRLALLSACLLAGTLLVLTAIKAAPTILYVDENNDACTDFGSGIVGQPFCTISEAASAAVAGQTVQVASGTYAENVTPTHSGVAGSPIIFTAAPGALVIITGKAAGSNGFTIPGKSYITIRNFTISGTVRYGISASLACSFLWIIGNHITGAGRSTNSSTIKPAINLNVATHSLIQNNILDHNTSSGVYLAAGSDGNTVDHNDISFNATRYTDSSGAYHRLAPGIDVGGASNMISNNISRPRHRCVGRA